MKVKAKEAAVIPMGLPDSKQALPNLDYAGVLTKKTTDVSVAINLDPA